MCLSAAPRHTVRAARDAAAHHAAKPQGGRGRPQHPWLEHSAALESGTSTTERAYPAPSPTPRFPSILATVPIGPLRGVDNPRDPLPPGGWDTLLPQIPR